MKVAHVNSYLAAICRDRSQGHHDGHAGAIRAGQSEALIGHRLGRRRKGRENASWHVTTAQWRDAERKSVDGAGSRAIQQDWARAGLVKGNEVADVERNDKLSTLQMRTTSAATLASPGNESSATHVWVLQSVIVK